MKEIIPELESTNVPLSKDECNERIKFLETLRFQDSSVSPKEENIGNKKDEETDIFFDNLDWVRLTDNYNLEKIKEIVNLGRSRRERKMFVKAIYDAEHSGQMYNIPYAVDSLIDRLYKENNDSRNKIEDEILDVKSKRLISELVAEDSLRRAFQADTQHRIRTPEESTESLLQQIEELKNKSRQLKIEKDELENALEKCAYEIDRLKKQNNDLQNVSGSSKIVLTNNSRFARVVQAMVSDRYFKRADGDETNATEVGNMLLKLFGVSNSWKSVLQKAFSRDNPLSTYDELRDAGEKYWTNRSGLDNDIRKKRKK